MSYQKNIKTDFNSFKATTRRIIRDLYGINGKHTATILEKLESCTTEQEIDRLLVWARTNFMQ